MRSILRRFGKDEDGRRKDEFEPTIEDCYPTEPSVFSQGMSHNMDIILYRIKHKYHDDSYHSSAAANLLAGFFPLVLFPPLVDDPDEVLVVLPPRLDVDVVRVVVRDFGLLVPPSVLGHATHQSVTAIQDIQRPRHTIRPMAFLTTPITSAGLAS